MDKSITATHLSRFARAAEPAGRAAARAEALYGADSLVCANQCVQESLSLSSLGIRASGAEREALKRASWNALLAAVAILQRRLADDTLLPGAMRANEEEYSLRALLCVEKAAGRAAPRAASFHLASQVEGYSTLVSALLKSLDFLRLQWPAAQRRSVESFALQALDVIPRTANITITVATEHHVVTLFEQFMSPRAYGSAFCALCSASGVQMQCAACSALEACCSLGPPPPRRADFQALERADIAEHGLRECALPSCDKTEKSVKEFKLCAGCHLLLYCCLEHQALDWKAHKTACRQKEAARLAAEEAAARTSSTKAA